MMSLCVFHSAPLEAAPRPPRNVACSQRMMISLKRRLQFVFLAVLGLGRGEGVQRSSSGKSWEDWGSFLWPLSGHSFTTSCARSLQVRVRGPGMGSGSQPGDLGNLASTALLSSEYTVSSTRQLGSLGWVPSL